MAAAAAYATRTRTKNTDAAHSTGGVCEQQTCRAFTLRLAAALQAAAARDTLVRERRGVLVSGGLDVFPARAATCRRVRN